MAKRITNIAKTLWNHKKKTVVGCYVLYLGADVALRWNLNNKIRSAYAELAIQYGQKTMSAEGRPRRLCVLANVAGNDRHCFDDFKRNALPLFHLAGIQVEIIKSDSETQLEALAAALDTEEADATYIVGGDGSIGRVVTGIFRNREKQALPVGIFPGGYDNLTLRRLVPAVFSVSEDVRRHCESAMAVIEEEIQTVTPFEYSNNTEDKPMYSIGDVGAGWFRPIEDKRKKLWYFGGLKRRWAYIWEMIKRSPEDFKADIIYEEACSGCKDCKPKFEPPKVQWRWWHILTGTPRYKLPDILPKDYSNIVNENCGKQHTVTVEGTDLLMESQSNEESSQLRLRVGGANVGRFGVIAEGMDRCSKDVVASSSKPEFYSLDVLAKSVQMTFTLIPEFISKLYVSSDAQPVTENQQLSIRSTNKKLQVYLPSALRIDVTTL